MSAQGILLVNTGTPEAPTPEAIKPYLERFLSDKRIVGVPHAIWKPILHGFVLPRRPQVTVEAYRHIWTPEGSPYTLYSRSIERKLKRHTADAIADASSEPPLIRMAHRYAEPDMQAALRLFRDHEIAEVTVLPLYPQQAYATTGSIRDELERLLGTLAYQPHVHFIEDYHSHPLYIDALATRIAQHLSPDTNPAAARLVFSFHSTPLKDLRAKDPYHTQTQASARKIAEAAHLPENLWEIAYQSRFADAQKWISPFLEETLDGLLAQGVRDFYVVAPGFAVDNIETLHEIENVTAAFVRKRAALRGHAAADISFTYLPALNDSDEHIELLAALISEGAEPLRHT